MGRVAVGWLIVEDLAMVLALVLLPAFAETMGGHAEAGSGTSNAVDRPHASSDARQGRRLCAALQR